MRLDILMGQYLCTLQVEPAIEIVSFLKNRRQRWFLWRLFYSLYKVVLWKVKGSHQEDRYVRVSDFMVSPTHVPPAASHPPISL